MLTELCAKTGVPRNIHQCVSLLIQREDTRIGLKRRVGGKRLAERQLEPLFESMLFPQSCPSHAPSRE